MSKYKGTLQHLNAFKGKISRYVLELKAQLTDVGPQFRGSIKRQNFFDGKLHSTFSLAGIIKKVYVAFCFFKAKKRVRVKHDANLSAVSIAEMKAPKKAKDRINAPLINAGTESTAARSSVKASTTARLVAYFKGNLAFIKKIFTPHEASLTTVKSAVASYQEEVEMKSTADIQAADTAICQSVNKIECQVKAAGIVADTNTTAVNKIIKPKVKAAGSTAVTSNASIVKEIKAETTAAAVAARAAEISIHAVPKVSHTAKLAMWGDPVLENGVLILKQAYSATQNDDVLEVI